MPELGQPFRGRVWKFGDSVDTNQLAGGGVHVSDDPLENLRANCLRGTRPDFAEQTMAGDILVAGTNFGCGSHRQTAVEALQLNGIVAVLAESVARIHMRNSIALALPTFVVPGIANNVEDGDVVEVDYAAGLVRNQRTNVELPFKKFPAAVERIYELGGLSPVIARKLAEENIVPDRPLASETGAQRHV
jgi:3-isopropylmalate dehydratase small subunit